MLVSIARRLVSMLVTLLGVSVIIFVILRWLPGNAVTASLGVNAGLLSHAQLVALNHYYGVGEPFFRQYGSWLGAMFTGNLGISLSSRTSVASLIGAAFPVTFELSIASIIIGELIGVLFGVFGSLRPGRAVDSVGQGVAVIGLGVPSFVIGTGLVTFLASVFHYFPSSEGWVSFTQDPWLNLQQILFPGAYARYRYRSGHHAHDARRHARGDGAELRPHRTREGARQTGGYLEAPVPGSARTDSYDVGHPVRVLARRDGSGGRDLRPARPRAPPHYVHQRSRFPRGPERDAHLCRRLHYREHAHGRHLYVDRPADAIVVSLAAPEQVVATQPVTSRRRRSLLDTLWHNPSGRVGCVLVGLVVLGAILGAVNATPYNPQFQNVLASLKPPSFGHLAGTDQFGRDEFSLVLAGLAVSLKIAASPS